LTIGLTHGAQVEPRGDLSQLENLAIEKRYNILISGHTHREEVFLTKKGILLINPGSVTGAWSFVASKNPSFIVLRVNENSKEIQVSLFQLNAQIGEIKESKLHFIFKEYKIHDRL
jgi:putative phosphoesterase